MVEVIALNFGIAGIMSVLPFELSVVELSAGSDRIFRQAPQPRATAITDTSVAIDCRMSNSEDIALSP
jgi:hypothetical protein